MKQRNEEEHVLKEKYFMMKEYTEILREYLGERRDITKKAFKIAGRIYRRIKNGATIEEIDRFIDMLKRSNRE